MVAMAKLLPPPFHGLPRADVGAKQKGKDLFGPVEIGQNGDEYDRLGDVVAQRKADSNPVGAGQHYDEQRQRDVGQESVNHPAVERQQVKPRNVAVGFGFRCGEDRFGDEAADRHGYGQDEQNGGGDQHHHRYFGGQELPASGSSAQHRAQRTPPVFAAHDHGGQNHCYERAEKGGKSQPVGDILGRRPV